MSVEVVTAGVILAALAVYVLGGGADFGGGVWDLLSTGPRAREQRETIADAIGPIWEANHVWLILVVVVLFTGFPVVFGALMTALHIPMTVVLLGVVLRGSAFAFRKYDIEDDATHRRWSTIFGAASLATPFFLGLCLGAIASGDIRVTSDGRVLSGFFAGWTSPFALACGVFAQALFAFLAATYLTVDTDGDAALQDDFRTRALVADLALVPLAVVVFVLAREGAPEIFAGLTSAWGPPLLAATGVVASGALVSLWQRRFRWARAFAVLQVASILVGWGLAQYPYAIVPDLTFAGTGAAGTTQRLLAWTLALGALLLFPSFAYLLHVFRRERERPPNAPADGSERDT